MISKGNVKETIVAPYIHFSLFFRRKTVPSLDGVCDLLLINYQLNRDFSKCFANGAM